MIQFHLPLLFLVCSTSLSNGQKELILDHTFSFYPYNNGTAHGLKASRVTLKDTQTILIEGLHYDGAGPDAYWMVGYDEPPRERPGRTPGHIIPNEHQSCNKLNFKGYNGDTITLTLPSNYVLGGSKPNSIEWLAMYCIKFKHNFGHVRIQRNVVLPKYTSRKQLPKACDQTGTGSRICKPHQRLVLGSFCWPLG